MTETEAQTDPLNPLLSERFLIGALGSIPGRLERELQALPGEAFYNPHFGHVWAAAAALQQRNVPIDPTNLARQLADTRQWNPGTETTIGSVMLAPRTPGPIDWHVGIVREYYGRRELVKFAVRARQIALQGDLDTSASDLLGVIHAELEKLDQQYDHEDDGPKPWSRLMTEWDAMIDSGGRLHPAFVTPWPNFNDALGGGLRGGRFYVWAGRPGMGKSTAAFNLAGHFGAHRVPSLFVSAEMSDIDVASRIISRGAGISMDSISRYSLDHATKNQLNAWREQCPNLLLWVESRPIALPAIKTLARRFKRRHGLAVLFVDYLQLIRSGGTKWGNREQEVAHISRELKGLALELDIAVVAPVQLNRASTGRADGKPMLSDLRESGQIEQDADVVVLLHHPEEEHKDENGKTYRDRTGEITFIIAKNRHGACMDIPLDWNPGFATIDPYRPPGVSYAS
jgi:replicative DNA helicase